jgi:XapX domain-containing protein
MKPHLRSLGAGLLVGTIYVLVDVHSLAPPVIALVGLRLVPLDRAYLQQGAARIRDCIGAAAHVR